MNTYEYAQRIAEEYDPEGSLAELTNPTPETWRLELATGGEEEREEYIYKLGVFDTTRQTRAIWAAHCWQSSHRGGLHVYGGSMIDKTR